MTQVRVVLDACVLFPTVMREVLLGCAAAGLFAPRWSARILEEWARATVKLGPGAEVYARGEIALDADDHSLNDSQRRGKALFLSTCITCHDRAKVDRPGPIWQAR